MIGFAAERLMEIEVAGLTGAAHGEKSVERFVQRTTIVTAIGSTCCCNGGAAHP